MTGSAVLTLIATILTAEVGAVEIDLGSKGGLRPGDEGAVFYEVVLDDQIQTVEIGSASVIETTSFTSKLSVAPDLPVRPGFLVRFDLSSDRSDSSTASNSTTPQIPETSSQSVLLSDSEPSSGASIAYVARTGGACLKVRSLPTPASPATGCLEEGTAVMVIQEVPEWSKALLDDRRRGWRGWLASRFLSAAPPQPKPPALADAHAPTDRSEPADLSVPETQPTLESSELPLEPMDAMRLLQELERAEALVRSQISQLASSQDAVLEAHEARAELSLRLLEATIEEYESGLAASEDRLRKAEQGRSELADKYDRLQKDLTTADSEFQRVNAERLRLVEQLEATNSELAQIQAIATAAKDALRREIRATETTLAALHGRLELREREFDGHGEELARAEAKVAIMQSEIDRLEAMAPRTRQEIENTRAALADASRRAADLEIRLAASDEQRKNLEKKLAAVRGKPVNPRAADSKPREASEPVAEIAAASSDGAAVATRVVVLESAKPCLNFRAEPKLDSQAFDCLPPGTRLGPLGHWEEWHYVELSDGRAGWVASRHLGPAGEGGSGP